MKYINFHGFYYIKQYILLFCFIFYTPIVLSFPLSDYFSDKRLIVSMGGGPAGYSAGERQTFSLTPNVANTYDPQGNNKTLVMGQLFIGYERLIDKYWLGQLGFIVSQSSNASLKGDVWQGADPDFNNLEYRYSLSRTYFGLNATLLFRSLSLKLFPYVNASLGVSLNNAKSYTETPKLFQVLAGPPFQESRTNAFSYTLGAGFQNMVNTNWGLRGGYAFSDWGRNSLKRSNGQTLNSGLSLTHLYTHQLLLSLVYYSV